MKMARVGGSWSARIDNKTRSLEVRERIIQDIIVFTAFAILKREKLEYAFDNPKKERKSVKLRNTPERCTVQLGMRFHCHHIFDESVGRPLIWKSHLTS